MISLKRGASSDRIVQRLASSRFKRSAALNQPSQAHLRLNLKNFINLPPSAEIIAASRDAYCGSVWMRYAVLTRNMAQRASQILIMAARSFCMRQGADFSAARDFMMRIRAAARRRILMRDRAFYTAFSAQRKEGRDRDKQGMATDMACAAYSTASLRTVGSRGASDKFSRTRARAAAKQTQPYSAFIYIAFRAPSRIKFGCDLFLVMPQRLTFIYV